jgi:hypothetical protein
LNILAGLIAPDETISIVAQNNYAPLEMVSPGTTILRHHCSSYSMQIP